MNYSLQDKETIGNIIGMNPTGIISFEGTFSMSGSNQNINTPANLSKEKMKQTENNEYICDDNNQNKETFQNYQSHPINKRLFFNNYQCYNWIFLYIILLFFFYFYCTIIV